MKSIEKKDPTEAAFSEESYEHVLEEGEPDFDDFSKTDLEQISELAFTEEQVQEAVNQMTPADRMKFEELKKHYQHQYRLLGYITPIREIVKDALDARYPGLPGAQSPAVLEERERLARKAQGSGSTEPGEHPEGAGLDTSQDKPEFKPDVDISKLLLYPAKTIAEVIDLTLDHNNNLCIKVGPNQAFHNVLTCKEEALDDLFMTDETSAVEEISIHSSDDEDPFTGELAAKILRKLAKNKREAASLQEEAADLLENKLLPLEEAKEVFKSGVESNQKSTQISEWLFDECQSINNFHLILALGFRVKEEAKVQRAVLADKVPKPMTFKKIAETFKVNSNTLINNLNLAVDFHNCCTTRSDKDQK